VHCSRPVTQSHVGRQRRGLSLFAEQLTARDWGAYVPTNPRTLLTASNGGPRKLGPTSDMGQCLTRHVSQGVEEWSGVDHQDVLMCPRQQSEGDVTSDISGPNNRAGPCEVDPRPHANYQLGRSLAHEGSMRVVWMTRSGVTQVKRHWKRSGP